MQCKTTERQPAPGALRKKVTKLKKYLNGYDPKWDTDDLE
jgi:hypothetical protein